MNDFPLLLNLLILETKFFLQNFKNGSTVIRGQFFVFDWGSLEILHHDVLANLPREVLTLFLEGSDLLDIRFNGITIRMVLCLRDHANEAADGGC